MTFDEIVEALKNAITSGQYGHLGDREHFIRERIKYELLDIAYYPWRELEDGSREQVPTPVSSLSKEIEALHIPVRDRVDYEVLRRLAVWHLEADARMSVALRAWAASELDNPSPPNWPKTKPELMDERIAWLVWEAWNYGLVPTRNAERDQKRHKEARPKETACDAVARAMRELGLRPSSYDRVAAIWKEYLRVLRTRDGLPSSYYYMGAEKKEK